MTDPQVGDVLGGKYEVEGILGRGGMGVVVAARHRELAQKVAIKCLLPHALAIRDVVERFAREARAAAQIHGEHVARVIDVGRFDDGTPYMVMEHLRGHDLADELQRRGPLPVSEAVRYLLEASEAIAQAHALRIVHRDLKPANLYLAETPGRPPIIKVLDFGISKVIEPNADALTKTASVMGTPFYMSPEQLLSAKNVDERTDIWALGVILYELLAGQPPFVGESVPEIVAQILQNRPAPLRARRPDVPPGLEAVVARCMQTKAEDRYANVALLSFALAEHAEPADRHSATAIARVLGAAPPPSLSEMADPSGRPAAALAVQTSATAQSARPPNTGTAHNLAVSAAGAPGAGNKWPYAVGGAFVVALGVGGATLYHSASGSRAAAAASPALSAAAVSEPTPPSPIASPQPTTALAPLPSVDPVPSAPSLVTRVSSAGQAALPAGHGPHGAAGPAASVATPRPSAASSPPTPAPTPSAAPQPAPPRNPLDLQLKQ